MEEKTTEKKQVIYSAIQPSGNITLGNYIGALRNFSIFDEAETRLYCVADLHSLTVRQNSAELRKRSLSLAALYMACGLDPENNIIYCQSTVSAHAELAWILNCFTYMGELSRMTQFKDKSAKHADNINAGLFTYPVLMASDILLYQTTTVPVGIDQKQHVEICRDIAQRFNSLYGDVFTVPEPYIRTVSAKIQSLSEPTKKMSKSDPEESFVSVFDKPDVIRRKIRRAVTDSETEIRYAPETKPGVSNLLTIISALENKPMDDVVASLSGLGYGALKEAAAEAVIREFTPIQARFDEIMADKETLSRLLKQGAEHAEALARKTLRKVYKKVGLVQL